MTEVKTKTVAQINKVDIVVIENGEKYVAIKPICEALGVASNGQIEKIKTDPILHSVNKMILSTGKDSKQYEMFVIPFKYVFGWLFQIDSRKVKEEAKVKVLQYQKECYDALYNYWMGAFEFIEYKERLVDKQIDVYDGLKVDFKNAERNLKEAKKALDERRALTREDYFIMKSQGSLFSENEMEG